MNYRHIVLAVATLISVTASAQEPAAAEPAPTSSADVRMSEVSVQGTIAGENILFQLDFTAECGKAAQWAVFVAGDVALKKVLAPDGGFLTSFEPGSRSYVMHWPKAGTYKTSLTFAARPKVVEGGAWREAEFVLPAARVRELEVVCDRTDLEVLFPGGLRVNRDMKDGKLTMKAILGSGLPFAVRWKPQVQELAGALVLASEANTIATVRAGALRHDSLYIFEIPQGKLHDLSFVLPDGLNVTQVRGEYIRDWSVEQGKDGRRLIVALNRPLTKEYALQIVSEMALAGFPTKIEMPVIRPEGVIRAGGHLALGTDSAIHMVVEQTSGLSQTEPAGFPAILLDREHPRPLPPARAFYYTYASTPYRMTLSLDDIVSSFDVTERHLVQVREDELSIETEFDLDVRDAPLRDAVIQAPSAFIVAAVTGEKVADYAVRPAADKTAQEVVVHFQQPVLGRTLLRMRLELGRSPLDERRSLAGIMMREAKSERGFVVVAAEQGVQVESPAAQNLREVNTASVPVTAPNAQFAYRYRERGWSLDLLATKKPSGLLAEAFHLASLGDGALYGYVVVNYFISGAPVDEFRFRVPKEIENVEFVGGDIRRWSHEGETWTVKLQRKVIGDYNLAISYSHPWKPGEPVVVGGIECEGMDRRSGFICVSSRLNLQVESAAEPDHSLMEIKTEEIPPNYRLLMNAPILKAYKYVAGPHRLPLKIAAYERSAVLPVVIELMELNTQLNITDQGATESVTRIRYKVKNASEQFLTLSLPPQATVWSTSLIERDGAGKETAARLTTSLDRQRGVMMIPLKRLRDPNAPMTIELVYGQEHPELTGGGRLKLVAPRSPVQTAFATWTAQAPKDWSILPSDAGNMAPQERRAEYRNLGDLAQAAARSWAWAAVSGVSSRGLSIGGGVLLLLIALALFLKRKRALPAIAGLVLLALIFLGIRATAAPSFRAFVSEGDLPTATYTRAIGLDSDTGMTVAGRVAPSWRRDVTWLSAAIAPAVGLLLVVAAVRRRKARAVLLAVGVTLLLSGAARFPFCAALLLHVSTWGLPVLLILWLGPRLLMPMRRLTVAAAAILFMIGAPGCAVLTRPLPDRATLNQAVYELTAEKDSMKVVASLDVSTPVPTRIPLLPSGAILLSKEEISKGVEMLPSDGGYSIEFKEKGNYSVKVEFLYGLPEAGENQVRHFRMPVPTALTSSVEMTIPEKGIEVAAPTAVSFTKEETLEGTLAHVLLGPGDAIEFLWQPRARERSLETTAFYADMLSLVRFDTGLARGRHRIRFQIAQGELKEIHVRTPENVTVTAVEGEKLGAWRFNAETHEMEAHLTQAVGGEYVLTVTTQIAAGQLPATMTLSPLRVLGATNQRGILGLTTTSAVQITPAEHGGAMNVDDFAREAKALMEQEQAEAVRNAYRIQSLDDALSVAVAAVLPEIRSVENATFTVSDERLIYNGEIRVSVAKAGVFSLDLAMPEGYDVDTLGSPEMSHWDENAAAGSRLVQMHFRNKLLGETVLKVALSRPVGDLPEEIVVPRVEVKGALKHGGQISITSSRNVRLSVKERAGVSELNALDLGIRLPGALAFGLLRPDWALTLKTEIVKPRVNVDFLHVAEVSDGIIRHTHYLRYRFYNAGQKVLEVQAPKGAIGLEISGSEIAHLKESQPGSGKWRIELARAQYDAPYLLKLRFETQFDRTKGDVVLEPSTALDVDLQGGHVVADSTDRVELAAVSGGEALQPADARGLPATFGAGDLSGAAFCYRCPELPYRLAFRATRHAAASLLEASVLETTLNTVLSETGETMTQACLRLLVGSKRDLEVRLPPGAHVWSLSVNLRSEVPSKRSDGKGGEVLLIPLAQAVAADIPVEVNLIYISPPASGGTFAAETLRGPEFDLPLQDVHWCLYLPTRYKYTDFEGTLNVNEDTLRRIVTRAYDVNAYEQRVAELNTLNRKKALALQEEGNKLAQSGKPQEARQALAWANSYAFNDPELNEDTRVQLHSLISQQAVVGLVDRRNQLRQTKSEGAVQAPEQTLGMQFDQAQADRVRNSLNRDDSANLDRIIGRLIEMQEEASQSRVQLMVNVPLRGRMIELTRALQVKPNAEMTVSFKARRELPARVKLNWLWSAGLAVILLLVILGDRRLAAWRGARLAAAPETGAARSATQPKPTQGTEGPSAPEQK
jgi:hypothetical protein